MSFLNRSHTGGRAALAAAVLVTASGVSHAEVSCARAAQAAAVVASVPARAAGAGRGADRARAALAHVALARLQPEHGRAEPAHTARARFELAQDDPAQADPAQSDPLFGDDLDAEFAAEPAGFPDPFEGLNRVVLRLNRVLDVVVLDPLTRAYDFLVPEPVEPPLRRLFQHFGSASILLNDVLQLRPRAAGRTTLRFVVNSTTGVAGLFDFARCEGVVHHNADFGQTLALYGVGSGPYLMLPLLGPSNLRDAFGDFVDSLLHPARWFLGPAQQLTYGGGSGLATRERYYQDLKELEKSAIDYYAALRNAFYQSRKAEIEGGRGHERADKKRAAEDRWCKRTLAGEPTRRLGGPVALGRAAEPLSRWRRYETR